MRRHTRMAAAASAGMVALALSGAGALNAQVEEAFTGSAEAELLRASIDLGALTDALPSLADVGLSTTEADADNTPGSVATRGFARNLDAALGGTEIPLALSIAEQTAPPDNDAPTQDVLLPLGDFLSPLITGGVSDSQAWARDPAALSCPAEGRIPISMGRSTTTNIGILDLDELAGMGGSLISVTDLDGSGTIETTSGIYLGSAGQIISEANGPAVQLSIAGALDIEVIDPVLTATVTGQPGGATVEYRGQVLVNGEEIVGTSAQTISLTALAPILGPLDDLILSGVFGPLDNVLNALLGPVGEAVGEFPILGDLLDWGALDGPTLTELIDAAELVLEDLADFIAPTVLISVAEVDATTAANGTAASGSVAVVSVELTLVNTLLDTEIPLLSLALMPLTVDATVPVGGIDCGLPPLTVSKDGPETVAAGASFDYTITVTNELECTATDIVVVDTITGPAGFTVSATDPTADSVDGGVVTWEVDELAPGDSVVFTVTIDVPDNALPGSMFSNTAVANANCDGVPLPPGDDTLDGPTVDDPEVQLPRTGGGLALLAMGALAAAGVLRRRA